jgi:uncharacterized protein (TIGR02246 family)
MKTALVLAIACLCVPFVRDAQAQPPTLPSFGSLEASRFESNDRAEIERVLKSYEHSLNASDVNGVIRLYSDDAVLMAPGSPSAVGIQATQNAYAGVFQAIRLNITFQVAELHLLSSDWAFLRTNSTGQITILANGAVIPEGNQELFLLRKAHGQWKLARYSFSSFLPN